jgi:uncharacterized protein YjeT (DUF2065 family)
MKRTTKVALVVVLVLFGIVELPVPKTGAKK